MADINIVKISKRAQSDLNKVPQHIVIKLMAWISDVEDSGLMSTRRVSGYHDEPLKGTRAGQRSIRLSRAYRAIYEMHEDGIVEFVSIKEVNKHDYS